MIIAQSEAEFEPRTLCVKPPLLSIGDNFESKITIDLPGAGSRQHRTRTRMVKTKFIFKFPIFLVPSQNFFMLLSSVPDHLVVVVRVTCRLRVVVTNCRDVFVESSSSSIDARSKFSSYVKFLLKHFFCSSYYSTRWSPTTTKSGKAWLVGWSPSETFRSFFHRNRSNFRASNSSPPKLSPTKTKRRIPKRRFSCCESRIYIYFENRNGRAFERYLKPQLV